MQTKKAHRLQGCTRRVVGVGDVIQRPPELACGYALHVSRISTIQLCLNGGVELIEFDPRRLWHNKCQRFSPAPAHQSRHECVKGTAFEDILRAGLTGRVDVRVDYCEPEML